MNPKIQIHIQSVIHMMFKNNESLTIENITSKIERGCDLDVRKVITEQAVKFPQAPLTLALMKA